MPQFLAEPIRLGQEISITGKWIPTKKSGLFRTSAESKEMLKEWEDIHSEAKEHSGMLSTEINHAVGEEAVLVHHVFEDAIQTTTSGRIALVYRRAYLRRRRIHHPTAGVLQNGYRHRAPLWRRFHLR